MLSLFGVLASISIVYGIYRVINRGEIWRKVLLLGSGIGLLYLAGIGLDMAILLVVTMTLLAVGLGIGIRYCTTGSVAAKRNAIGGAGERLKTSTGCYKQTQVLRKTATRV